MGKKILIGITILLIAGLFTGWYLFTHESKYFGTSAFKAIPENASVIIRIRHLRNYTSKSLDNPFWKAFSGFPVISDLCRKLNLTDSLLNLNIKQNKLFADKDLTIVLQEEDDHIQWLSLIELSSLTEKRALADLSGKYFSRNGISMKKIKSVSAELSCYSWKEAGIPYLYFTTVYQGLFMGSTSQNMVTSAINQLENKTAKGNALFEKANKSATGNIDMNIYLNHQRPIQLTRNLFSEAFWDRIKNSARWAEWSEIDLTQKSDELILNGFSSIGDSLKEQLELFHQQKPDSFNLTRVFPVESSFFLGYVISDNSRFFRDYEKLLKGNLKLMDYKKSLFEIDSMYDVKLQKVVEENMDGGASIVFTRSEPEFPEENKYFVMRVKSGSQIEEALSPLATLMPVHRKREKPKNFTLYQIDEETTFKIYQSKVTDFGKQVFGEVFADVTTNYYTIFDNYLIMCTSVESLGRFLRSNVFQETLWNDPAYLNFTSGLSDRLNVFLWSKPGRSFNFFKETLNSNIFQNLAKNQATLLKIESAGWQIGNENGMIYNMARLKYNPIVHQSPTSVLWRRHLGSRIINGPYFVINPGDKSRQEIIVQDEVSNLILMTREGRILWKIKLKGPIKSKIFQLDCFRDGKLQYFFSTADALHMIDHKGNSISHFPIILRSAATNGVSVADYDHTKDYRFFIACKDHKVYVFDKKGKIVTGWAPPKTEHNVLEPVQFFRVENKDYLVFTDKNKGYILDRKGKTVITIKGDLTFSKNSFTLQPKSGKNHARLISTDVNGKIISIGFDGSVKKSSIGKFSANHFFICEDTNSDNHLEYLILNDDSLVVCDQNTRKLFSRKFNHPIGLPPQILILPDKSRKIGITDTFENKIYLLNSDGTDYTGFPIEGNSAFTLGFSGNEIRSFNIVTGTSDGFLNNYQMN